MTTQFALYGDELGFGEMLDLIDSRYDFFVGRHAVAGRSAPSMLIIRSEAKQLLIEKIVNVSGLFGQFLS
ncbi:MAG: hypothetical protein WBG27_04495 [Candidatus Aquilonibacter sp.]